MSAGTAVTDASPLIALAQIDRLDLLQSQFQRVVVPPAIEREVVPSVGSLPAWVHRHPVAVPREFLRHLDPGEREAVALALDLDASFVIVDDLQGRRAATGFGLRVIGSLGLLVGAKRSGLTTDVRPLMDALIANGPFVSEQVYHEILALAGEADLQANRVNWSFPQWRNHSMRRERPKELCGTGVGA